MKTLIFKNLAEEWLYIKRLSVKQSSVVKYETILTQHILPFFKDCDVNQINNLCVIDFFDYKLKLIYYELA